MSGRKYTPEFREQLVREVIDTSRTIAEVSRENNVPGQTLGIWVNDARRARQENSENGDGQITETEVAELARLRREVQKLKAEKEFLGNAAAFFAKEYR
ncbi:Transposase and inactivated derivatives [Quadrisphaera granulorum]|uniref:Transposase-like protein n=1 Tax=Quadrisphaera granulorum TaxID=317664 RepID=A0A315ZKG3_9ACTN|nr:transposase [Quadrisphaera granulorum]PWJ45812.1 transposase-like protein [Quadrisphaera granulorum]SZE99117.1 Transposase and inactivated derivatives [Quadrisphaera granulorum]